MEVFAFREENIGKFERSSRNFTNTRAEDTSREVDAVNVSACWESTAMRPPFCHAGRQPTRYHSRKNGGRNMTHTAENHGAVKQSP